MRAGAPSYKFKDNNNKITHNKTIDSIIKITLLKVVNSNYYKKLILMITMQKQ